MRNYKATFIISPTNTARQIDEVINFLKETVSGLGAEVIDSEDLGLKDCAYVTNKQEPQVHFVTVDFKAEGDINTALQQKLKLEKEVKQVMVELQATANA